MTFLSRTKKCSVFEADRRLIEDYLPIQTISEEASRSKNVRTEHFGTRHVCCQARHGTAAKTGEHALKTQ